MSDNNVDSPKKEKGWLYSDIYDKPNIEKNPLPRLSIFKFGSFGDVLTNGGKLVVQGLISSFLFIMLLLLLVAAATENNDQYFLAAYEIVALVCTTISVFLVVKIFDDSNISELGLQLNRQAFLDFLFGFIIIFLIFALEFLFLWATGLLKIEHIAWETQSVASILPKIFGVLLIFIFVGWNEELLSRGFHLRIISKGLNRPLGIILSSAIFSYAHHNNPEATPGYLLFIFIFGVMLSLAFLRTGQLWLAVGLHAGWDFCVTIFGGTAISDLKLFHLFEYRLEYNPLFYLFIKIIILSIILILIRVYTSNRNVGIPSW